MSSQHAVNIAMDTTVTAAVDSAVTAGVDTAETTGGHPPIAAMVIPISHHNLEAVGNEIAELAAHIHAPPAACSSSSTGSTGGRMERLGHVRAVALVAHWYQPGGGPGEVRVARALHDLPKITKTFQRGEISYSKVRAMTRIASPELEDSLLNIALHGTASHVEKVVRGYRRADPERETAIANWHHEDRFLSTQWDDQGNLVIRGQAPTGAGAAGGQGSGRGDGRAGGGRARPRPQRRRRRPQRRGRGRQRRGWGQRGRTRAGPARTFATHVPAAARGRVRSARGLGVGGEASGSPRGGYAPGRRTRRLRGPRRSGGGWTKPAGGRSARFRGNVAPSRVRCQRGCAAGGRGREPAVGGTRSENRAAIASPGVAPPGPGLPVPGLSSHPVPGSAPRRTLGGRWGNQLENLVHLCSFHHRELHEGGYRIRWGAGGEPEFVTKYGVALGDAPRQPNGSPDGLRGALWDLDLDADRVARWSGDRINYADAVTGLLNAAGRVGPWGPGWVPDGQDVSAETAPTWGPAQAPTSGLHGAWDRAGAGVASAPA